MKQINIPEYYSLYDYLGRAAGETLGTAVYITARDSGVPMQERKVTNSKYKGQVKMYPIPFLDLYFKANPEH